MDAVKDTASNDRAVENFLSGKRSLAAFQFSKLIRQTNSLAGSPPSECNASSSSAAAVGAPSSASTAHKPTILETSHNKKPTVTSAISSPPANTTTTANADNSAPETTPLATPNSLSTKNLALEQVSTLVAAKVAASSLGTQLSHANEILQQQHQGTRDEIAYNYALVNLFTGCPQKAALVFSKLVSKYPQNPRLWLRLAESKLNAERAGLSEFEHIQQLTLPGRDRHIVKTQNRPILVKINPDYCQTLSQQQRQLQHKTPPSFLMTVASYLMRSLNLINEFSKLSLITDDMPLSVLSTTSVSQITSSLNSMSLSPDAVDNSDSQLINWNAPSSPKAEESPATAPEAPGAAQSSSHAPYQSKVLSYANPYQCISRSDIHRLKIKVCLNLAYISLCTGETTQALAYASECFTSKSTGYERVLAHLYHAEACILLGRADEAIETLNIEVLNIIDQLCREHPIVTGKNSRRVVYDDELRKQLKMEVLANVLTYNLSVAYAAKGEFDNAELIIARSVRPMSYSPMQMLICMLYLHLQRGNLDSAKRLVRRNLPQYI